MTATAALVNAGFQRITSGECLWRRRTGQREFIIEALLDGTVSPSEPLQPTTKVLCEGTEAVDLGLAGQILPLDQVVEVINAGVFCPHTDKGDE